MSFGQPKVFLLSGPSPCSENLAAQVETLKGRCKEALTQSVGDASYLVGLGHPRTWPKTTVPKKAAPVVWVWFEDFFPKKAYHSAIEQFQQVSFLHGANGLAELTRLLEEVGVLLEENYADPLADDAFFRLRGDYLFQLKDEFTAVSTHFAQDKESDDKDQIWKNLINKIAGSAGTYEFDTLSNVAIEAYSKYENRTLSAVAIKKVQDRLHGALSEELETYNRQIQECLPTPIEIGVRQRVLALIDDPSITNQLRFALSHSRIEVEYHDNPAEILSSLHMVQPDILVIQQALRHFNGLDLAAHLRSIEQFSALPILALLNESSEAMLTRSIRSGVDNWLNIPFSAANIAMSVLNLLRRVEVARKLGGRDPLTGLYTKEAMLGRLQGDLSRVRRSGQQIAILLIHLTNVESPRLAFLELADIANKIVRRSDLLARYNEATLAVILPGIDMRTIVSVTNRFRIACENSYSYQIAATICDGMVEPQALIADVETRLSRSLSGITESAIGILQPDLSRRQTAESPRILIADADEAIVNLLRFFCAREGFEVHDVRNGTDTIEYLDSAREEDRLPDVLVIEAFLPGVDGFQILEKVSEEFAGRISVIMLSVHPSEERIAKALQLGATDFVAKPFRVPEIIARIRNGLLRTWVA